jgi:hypothetical protein
MNLILSHLILFCLVLVVCPCLCAGKRILFVQRMVGIWHATSFPNEIVLLSVSFGHICRVVLGTIKQIGRVDLAIPERSKFHS